MYVKVFDILGNMHEFKHSKVNLSSDVLTIRAPYIQTLHTGEPVEESHTIGGREILIHFNLANVIWYTTEMEPETKLEERDE